MKPSILVLFAAAALPLGACTSMNDDGYLASAGTGAAIGAAGGAGVSALAGGDLLTGAVIGAAVGGIAGAVWHDRDNDGRVDGYVREGRYYEGAPAGYQAGYAPECRSVTGTALTGAAVGAAGGAVVGALAGGPLAGALIGAAVGGLGGAVWADANNDGCVDGYVREGRYYEGAPSSYSEPVVQPTAYGRGERG
jgi:hypothetical protein